MVLLIVSKMYPKRTLHVPFNFENCHSQRKDEKETETERERVRERDWRKKEEKNEPIVRWMCFMYFVALKDKCYGFKSIILVFGVYVSYFFFSRSLSVK